MNWYCIHTRPQCENRIVGQIQQELGYEVFFPKLKRLKTIRRVRRQVSEPLFPRYFFCRFDLMAGYRAVRYTHDVLDVVSFGAAPAIVDEQLIVELKAWSTEAGQTIQVGPSFVRGDHVQVTQGPMQGLHAVILEDKCENDRVAVLLWILGCGAKTSISRFEIAKTA